MEEENVEGHSIPIAISRLTGLRHLSLAHSMVPALPDAMSTLARLTYLDCSGGMLRAWPPVLRHLTALQALDIGTNAMGEELPGDAFQGLQQLQVLSLASTGEAGMRRPCAHGRELVCAPAAWRMGCARAVMSCSVARPCCRRAPAAGQLCAAVRADQPEPQQQPKAGRAAPGAGAAAAAARRAQRLLLQVRRLQHAPGMVRVWEGCIQRAGREGAPLAAARVRISHHQQASASSDAARIMTRPRRCTAGPCRSSCACPPRWRSWSCMSSACPRPRCWRAGPPIWTPGCCSATSATCPPGCWTCRAWQASR